MQYTTLPRKVKDRIYKHLQRFKVKKSLIQNRSFYNKEDYTPIPMTDITKIMKSLNDSLSPAYPKIEFSRSNPNFLYDFLKIMKEAVNQGIEDEIPEEAQDFYNTIILPIAQSGRLKNKVQNLLFNLHDPLFTSDKAYQWMRLDEPKEVVVYDYELFPTALHHYYAEICSDQRLRERFYDMKSVQEMYDFVRGCQKRGISFRHNFDDLVSVFWNKMSYEPYRSMLMNTGNRPICYIDKDSYLGIIIRNNGTPAPYLQTAYHNLKVGKNKAGQALMQTRYELTRYYSHLKRRPYERVRPCSKKRKATKEFLKKTSFQLAA